MKQLSTLMWEQHRGRWHKPLNDQEKKSARSLRHALKGCVILGNRLNPAGSQTWTVPEPQPLPQLSRGWLSCLGS